MCLKKQDSEYVSRPIYAEILNMANSEYGRVISMRALHSVLDMPEEYASTVF